MVNVNPMYVERELEFQLRDAGAQTEEESHKRSV